jgi:hypothetical protein
MASQSKVYECSRQNASVLLNEEGTEWINEFKEGIELEPLDQVRILGSFVNEQAEGSEIEITDKMEFNIIHTPYILANTLATTKNNEDLMDLSSFSDYHQQIIQIHLTQILAHFILSSLVMIHIMVTHLQHKNY